MKKRRVLDSIYTLFLGSFLRILKIKLIIKIIFSGSSILWLSCPKSLFNSDNFLFFFTFGRFFSECEHCAAWRNQPLGTDGQITVGCPREGQQPQKQPPNPTMNTPTLSTG